MSVYVFRKITQDSFWHRYTQLEVHTWSLSELIRVVLEASSK